MKKLESFKKRNFTDLTGVGILQEETNQSLKLTVTVKKKDVSDVQQQKFFYVAEVFLNNLENLFKKI